jgi:hypothetical protein
MTADEGRPQPALRVEVEEQSTGALTRVSDASMLICQNHNLLRPPPCAATPNRGSFDSQLASCLSARPSRRAPRSTRPSFIVMSKATGRLSDVLAALRLLAPVAGLLPFGDKLIAGVNIAINLCEAAQVRPSLPAQFLLTKVLAQTAKSNESAYEDLSSRCTSLLLSVATCLRTADPNKRPIMIKDMEALVQ